MPEIPHSKKLLIICLSLLLSVNIFAHDTGMSSVNVESAGDVLIVRADYSLREIENVPTGDNDPQALARTNIRLIVDGQRIEPDEASYQADAHAIAFSQTFRRISGARIKLESPLLDRLAPGHRQFLYARREDGKTVLNEILTSENRSATIDFERLAPDTSFGKFLPLGMEHILFGYDHLLFLLTLLLTVQTFGEIAKIVTSFTIAHSITLSLAALGHVQVTPALVEPLIALSIVFVGLENLLKKPTGNRWILTYFFGLIHGFGFASALQEVGIGSGLDAAVPLLSFNLGVEIGQLAVVLLILPVLWKLCKSSLYLSRIVPIGSAAVALAGLYWLIERTLF